MQDPMSPGTLPSVTFEERRTLPQICAVYYALDSEGEILYIGASTNLSARWRTHNKSKVLLELGCAMIAYYPCLAMEASKIEGELIRYYQPVLNRMKRYLPLSDNYPGKEMQGWNMSIRIEQLRQEKGWTKKELGKRSGLQETHVYKICSGQRARIEAETVRRLARAFAVSTDYLLGMDIPDEH